MVESIWCLFLVVNKFYFKKKKIFDEMKTDFEIRIYSWELSWDWYKKKKNKKK